ncbi:hypothetical protein PanWU01x14_046450, partial [Parasponia andersonii]
ICFSDLRIQLRAKKTAPFWEPWYGELGGVGALMREVKPHGYGGESAVCTPCGESKVECADTLSNVGRPPEEPVGDDAKRGAAFFGGNVAEEAAEWLFKVARRVEEVDDLGWRQVFGVLGAGERELGEGDVGIMICNGGTKVANVERSVSYSD